MHLGLGTTALPAWAGRRGPPEPWAPAAAEQRLPWTLRHGGVLPTAAPVSARSGRLGVVCALGTPGVAHGTERSSARPRSTCTGRYRGLAWMTGSQGMAASARGRALTAQPAGLPSATQPLGSGRRVASFAGEMLPSAPRPLAGGSTLRLGRRTLRALVCTTQRRQGAYWMPRLATRPLRCSGIQPLWVPRGRSSGSCLARHGWKHHACCRPTAPLV